MVIDEKVGMMMRKGRGACGKRLSLMLMFAVSSELWGNV
jgi:hypothetical protein